MWYIIKEIMGRAKSKIENLPRRITIREKEIFDKKTTAKQFNDYFIDIIPNLVCRIQNHKDINIL